MKQYLKQVCHAGLWAAMWLLVLVSCDFSRKPLEGKEAGAETFRVLLVGDPFAMAMSRGRASIEEALGFPVEFEIVGYTDGRALTLLNARDERSRFDLVAFDVVWLGEYHTNGILKDLSGRMTMDRELFLENALGACEMEGALYGLPIQPHSELLWVRKDILEASGMRVPVTTEDVLALARWAHDPEKRQYGVAWNAQRGQPLGQTMAHFFAAFGVSLLDEDGMPAFATEAGLEAARFAMALLAVSPPDIHSMAWDQRTARFASGQVAMTYGWGARAYMAEDAPYSKVKDQVLYVPPPHSPSAAAVAPLGVWALGIPSNVADTNRAVRALEALFALELQQELVLKGNGSPGLRALAADPALQARFPVLATMADLDQADRLRVEIRPRIPQWDALCEILGNRFHDMLLGSVTAEAALEGAYTDALELIPSAKERMREQ